MNGRQARAANRHGTRGGLMLLIQALPLAPPPLVDCVQATGATRARAITPANAAERSAA